MTQKEILIELYNQGKFGEFLFLFLIDGFINIACPAAQEEEEEEEEEETQFPDGGGGRDHSRQFPLFYAQPRREKASAIAFLPIKGAKINPLCCQMHFSRIKNK